MVFGKELQYATQKNYIGGSRYEGFPKLGLALRVSLHWDDGKEMGNYNLEWHGFCTSLKCVALLEAAVLESLRSQLFGCLENFPGHSGHSKSCPEHPRTPYTPPN